MVNKIKSLLLLIAIIGILLIVGCSQNTQNKLPYAPSPSNENLQAGSASSIGDSITDSEISIPNNNGNKLVQKITYRIEIPVYMKAYNERDPEAEQIIFKKDGKIIGGLSDILYGPEMPVSVVRPNYNKVLESKRLNGFEYEVWQEKLEVTIKDSFNQEKAVNQTHIYFLFGAIDEIAYDLYFNDNDIDENTILDIAKSFYYKV